MLPRYHSTAQSRGLLGAGQRAPSRSEAPSELSGWGEPVGVATNAASEQEIDLSVREPSRYFLIWFNKAAPARDQEGLYEIEVSDVKLFR
jgi:hypothetical protein